MSEFKDAARRGRIEDALRESEARLNAALAVAGLGTFEWDLRTDAVVLDARSREIFGFADGEGVRAQEVFDRIHPSDFDRVSAEARASMRALSRLETEYRVKLPDGTIRAVVSISEAVPGAGGEAERLSGVFKDITERKKVELALRESEQKLRAIYDGTHEYIGLLTTDGTLLEANRSSLEFAGSRREDVVGKPFWETVWFESTPGAPEFVREAVGRAAAGEFVRWESPIITPAGEAMTFDISLFPVRNERGEVVLIVTEGRDVTERRREELDRQFLLELGEKIRFGDLAPGELLGEATRAASEHLGAARCLFIEIDEAANRGAVRHEYCRGGVPPVAGEYKISDYSPETLAEIKGGRVVVNHDAKRDPRTAAIYETTYEPYGERSYVSIPLFTDGRWSAIFWISDDKARRWTAQEVTFLESVGERAWLAAEKLRNEATLRESEARLRLAVGISRISTFEIDLLTDAVETDEVGREMYGFGHDEPLTFAKVQSHFHPEDRDEVIRRVSAALDPAGTEEFEVEQRIVRADGETRWIRVRGRAFFDGVGASRRAVRCLGTYIDITRNKRAEQEREELLRRERAARREAEDASRLKDEFLATVSHELRTPLTAILGWSKMLRDGNFEQDYARRAVETIYRNAKAQAQLVEDILDVSRVITGKLRINARPAPLAPVIQTAVESLRPSIEAKSIRLQMRFDFEPRMTLADPDRLQQVIWNLLANAVKFTPEGGQVRVELESGESETRIVVADTGKGIEPEFLPFVFDRFRQADGSTTRQHGGLGLGLAIVRHIVELHGGRVEVSSEGAGRGTTFTVRLPLSEAPPAAVEEAGAGAPAAGLPRPAESEQAVHLSGVKGLRVLLVDDEEDTLELLSAALTQSGVEVSPQTNVRDALEAVREWKPDVIVSDIAMPEEDGYAFIRKLRALPPEDGGAIPAVALTAYVGIKERTQVLSSGFQMYVPKPVEASELLSTLASLCG